jgi:hypothetical protein
MKPKLKQGAVVGLTAAVICTVLFATFWYFTLPPDLSGSDHSITRWLRGPNVSAHLLLAAVVFVSSGLIGFVMGAFRPDTTRKNQTRKNHETSA